jgi:chorismate dehydratase
MARRIALAFFMPDEVLIMALRIGQIDYANCTPLFTALVNHFDCTNYQFIRGVPAKLNAMLCRGEIDLCPSSSFEYGKSSEKYYLLPGLSISSIGAVKSVLLFSRLPIGSLNNQPIGLTTESDTSVNLLKIILAKGYGYANVFQRTSLTLHEALNSFGAILLIGDAALKERIRSQGLYIYDLGEMWQELTGLPFVFALWIVTREAAETKGEEVKSLASRLLEAKNLAYGMYEEIAAGCEGMEWIGCDMLADYWRTISYDLTPQHVAGVRRFFSMAKELGLLPDDPELRFFPGFSD